MTRLRRTRVTKRDMNRWEKDPSLMSVPAGYVEEYICSCGVKITAATPAGLAEAVVAHWDATPTCREGDK